MTRSLSLRQRKALGAYYTDESVARFLVAWALPEPGSAVMDPSCGDGRFLELATERGASRLVGCDISPDALAASRERLAGSSAPVELACADFFAVEPGAFAAVDAVVGNPPFIRYQRFDQHSRRRALASALRIGVRLTRLTSSWEGRSYGGGILKVEPRELDRVLVPWPELAPNRLEALADLVDRHLRAGRFGQASQAVDEVFLGQGLGASGRSLAALRGARRRLVERRTGRRRARTG